MQILEFANKKSTSKINKNKQQVEESIVKENLREVKGSRLATSRRIYRLENSDTFYVESESTNDLYYFIRYEPSFTWCSCLDNSTRHIKCKHIFAVEYSIRKNTLQVIDRLPKEAKRDNMVPESYRDDDYDF